MKSFLNTLLLLTIILLFVMTGCGTDGPDGPPGHGVPDFDSIPPEVHIIWPPPNYTAYYDSITFDIQASDNGYIDKLYLNINGQYADSLTYDELSGMEKYFFNYTFPDTVYTNEMFTVSVEAVDSAKNSQVTPVRPYFRQRLGSNAAMLEYYYDSDFLCYPFPSAWVIDEDTTLIYEQMAVRFTPESSGRLVALEVQFGNPLFWADSLKSVFDSVLVRNSDLRVIIWDGQGGNLPVIPVDSLEFLAGNLKDASAENPRWSQFPLGNILGDSADFRFEADQDFFIALRSTSNWTPTLDSGFYVRVSVDDSENPIPEPGGFRSLELEEGEIGRGWGNSAQHDAYKNDYYVRAVVQYDDEVSVSRIASPRISRNTRLDDLEVLKRKR